MTNERGDGTASGLSGAVERAGRIWAEALLDVAARPGRDDPAGGRRRRAVATATGVPQQDRAAG